MKNKTIFQYGQPIILGVETETNLLVSLNGPPKYLNIESLLEIKQFLDESLDYWRSVPLDVDDINSEKIDHFEYSLTSQKEKKVSKKKKIYLMIDTITGFCKIGISVNPNYRESTLQSEKPSVELIWSSSDIKSNAKEIERELHEQFSDKRIRGEWFNLTVEDINYIKENYNTWMD